MDVHGFRMPELVDYFGLGPNIKLLWCRLFRIVNLGLRVLGILSFSA